MRMLSSPRLVFAGLMLSLLAASCGEDSNGDDDDCDRGEEGCRCKSNDTCDTGLVCDIEEDECVSPGAGGSSGKGGSGGKAGSSGSSGKGGVSTGGTVNTGGSINTGGSNAGSGPAPGGNGGQSAASGSSGEGGEGAAPSGGSSANAGEGGEAGGNETGGNGGSGNASGTGGSGGFSGGSQGGSGGFSGGSQGGFGGGGYSGIGGFSGNGTSGTSAGGSSGTSAGGSSGSPGTGGTSGGGSSGGPGTGGGVSGGSGGGGGSSGQTCKAISVGEYSVVDDDAPELVFVDYNVNDSDFDDFLDISYRDYDSYTGDQTGTITLGSGANNNFETCSHCVLLYENSGAAYYFATAGTLTLAADSHQMWGYPKGSLSNVTLREVEIDDTTWHSTLVTNGDCFTVANLTVTVPPPAIGWLNCPAWYYGDGTDCDCGCGAGDPDCSSVNATACDYCWCAGDEGSCDRSIVGETNNGICAISGGGSD